LGIVDEANGVIWDNGVWLQRLATAENAVAASDQTRSGSSEARNALGSSEAPLTAVNAALERYQISKRNRSRDTCFQLHGTPQRLFPHLTISLLPPKLGQRQE
jgi:hypothetical protein